MSMTGLPEIRRRPVMTAGLFLAAVIAAGCSGPSPGAEKVEYENIHQAALHGDIDAVTGFLEKGVSVDEMASSGTPLHNAVENNQVAMVALLLENGADVSMRRPRILSDEEPIHAAAGAGSYRVVKLLIRYGADVNAQKSIGNISGLTPLHETVLNRQAGAEHLKTAEILLENGANVNARAVMGDQTGTPLDAADQLGHDEIAALLRRHGGRK